MTTGFSAAFYAAYLGWDQYNKPPGAVALTNAQMRAQYRLSFMGPPGTPLVPFGGGGIPAPPTATIQPPVAVPIVRGAVLPVPKNPATEPPPPPAVAAVRAPFTTALFAPRSIPSGHANWTAVKVLGGGGGGVVVLWQYTGLAAAAPAITKIAVKSRATYVNDSLQFEGSIMTGLNTSRSQHITKLIVDPPHVMTAADCAAEGIPMVWNGITRRLIMEYYEQGSLLRLIRARQDRNVPFAELTLWRVFECLVDGLSALEYNGELDMGGGPVPLPTRGFAVNDAVVVHYDLKPDNIKVFSGDRNNSHPLTPVWKIGDFGLASQEDRTLANFPPAFPFNSYQQMHNYMRSVGTDGYFVPMGAVMYELACFDRGPPEAYYPFNPAHLVAPHVPYLIRGAPALGILFGTHLRAVPNLSNELKDTIQECLYEEPVNRPTLITLKANITRQITNLVQLGEQPEGWHDLNTPEPMTRVHVEKVDPQDANAAVGSG
ncbi:kinase-like domain-containing protein [Rhexocercosporidium sp. MPI-PUGE-AT-0058]|nr:kinase-like domain-containing protein [Rhexocercosporidium sp. MPI-PUGE-AT-0058]